MSRSRQMIGVMRRLSSGLAVAAVALAVAAPAARADVTIQYFTLPRRAQGRDQRARRLARRDRLLRRRATAPERAADRPAEPGARGAGHRRPGSPWVKTPDAPGCCCLDLPRLLVVDAATTGSTGRAATARSARSRATREPRRRCPDAPWGIVAAPDGGAWMTEYGSSNVGPAYARQPDRARRHRPRPERVPEPRHADRRLGRRCATTPSRRGSRSRRTAGRGSPRPTPGNPGYRLGDDRRRQSYTEYRPCPTAGALLGLLHRHRARATWPWPRTAPSGTRTSSRRRSAASSRTRAQYAEYRAGRHGDRAGRRHAARDPRRRRTGRCGSRSAAGSRNAGANAIVQITPAAAPTFTVYKLGAALRRSRSRRRPTATSGSPARRHAAARPIGRLTGARDAPAGPGRPAPRRLIPGTGTPPGSAPPVTTTKVTPATPATAKVTDPTVRGDLDHRQPDLRRPAAGPLQPRLPDPDARVRAAASRTRTA